MNKFWPLTLAAAASLILSPCSYAQSTADAVYNDYNSAFIVHKGSQTFYSNSLTDRSPAFMWGQASDIYAAEDYFARTHDVAAQKLIADLLDTFLANNNGADWSWDSWNDDTEWGVIACVRGYQITGDTKYLDAAAKNWNMTYNRGWDTKYGGGGVWENMDNFVHGDGKADKCSLSNNPLVITGVALYQITGDQSYLIKSEAIYAWERSNVFNTTTGQVNEGVKWVIGKPDSGFLENSDNIYNDGSFTEAAECLYRITGNPKYHRDALLAISHVVSENSIMSYKGQPGNPQYQYWFVKGLSDYCTDNKCWNLYYSWLLDNANQAWKERDTLGLTEDDWLDPQTNANPCALNASSAVTIWQVLPPATEVPLSGNYEIVDAGSGLALGVGSKASHAPVVEGHFAPGAKKVLWSFEPTSGGYYQIKNAASDLVMTAAAASVLPGSKIVQDPAQGMIPGSDEWMPIANSDGTYSFYNLNSQQNLDVPAAVNAADTQVDQTTANGASSQRFLLRPHTNRNSSP